MRTFTEIKTGRVIQQSEAFALNGFKFPANWLELATAEDLAAHGIAMTEQPDPVPAPPALAEVQAGLCRRLDADAERVRLRYISGGVGQALTYREKVDQALAVLDLGEAAANALTEAERIAQYPMLAASVGIEADTLHAAATLVVSRYETWSSLGGAIERVRLGTKRAIQQAPDAAAAQAAYEAASWPT